MELVVSGAIGAALTVIIPLITRWSWPRWVKVIVSLVLTAGVTAAVIVNVYQPDMWQQIVAYATAAFGVGQAVFQLLKPTGLFEWLEYSTTPESARPKYAEEDAKYFIDISA